MVDEELEGTINPQDSREMSTGFAHYLLLEVEKKREDRALEQQYLKSKFSKRWTQYMNNKAHGMNKAGPSPLRNMKTINEKGLIVSISSLSHRLNLRLCKAIPAIPCVSGPSRADLSGRSAIEHGYHGCHTMNHSLGHQLKLILMGIHHGIGRYRACLDPMK